MFHRKGIIFGLLAAFSFSLMVVCVKAAHPIPPQEVIFARSVFNLILSYAVLKAQGAAIWGSSKNRWLLILRGLAGYGALSAYFFSLIKLPIGTASLIQYMSPVFSGIMAHFALRENSSRGQWFCLLFGLLGVGFIAHVLPIPSLNASIEWYYWFACLGSACLSGIAYVCVRRLSLAHENPEVIVFYFPLISLPLSLLCGLTGWVIPNTQQWFLLFGVGLSSYLGQVFLTHSLKNEKTSVAANTLYSGALFAVLWGILFFHELPDWSLFIGATFIIGSQVLLLHANSSGNSSLKQEHPTQERLRKTP